MAKHGYEQVRVDKIRRLLKEHYGIDDARLGGTKTQLVALLIEQERAAGNEVPDISEEQMAAVFDGAEEEEEKAEIDADEAGVAETQPAYGSEEWQEYVMRQFREYEFENGQPTCVACRRLVGQLIGPIVDARIPYHIGPSVENQGTATVVYSLEVVVQNESHPAHGHTLHFEDIADVNEKNTDKPYCKYPSASAATRAEGRICRKILGINRATAEETSVVAEEDVLDEGWKPREPIEDHQINTINTLCKRLNISVMGLINCGSQAYPNIEAVSKETAGIIIQYLNAIQQDKKPKPDDIEEYQANWRDT